MKNLARKERRWFLAKKTVLADKIELDDLIGDPIDKANRSAIKKSNMQRDAKFMANEVRKRTRLGKGVDREGSRAIKLKPFKSEKTELRRSRLRKLGRLSGFTRPGRSNLTETGQLLDALDGRSDGPGRAQIFLRENRNDGQLNVVIAEGQEDQGRKFMHLSFAEINRLKRRIRERIIKLYDESLEKS